MCECWEKTEIFTKGERRLELKTQKRPVEYRIQMIASFLMLTRPDKTPELHASATLNEQTLLTSASCRGRRAR